MRKTKREAGILAVLAEGRVGRWTNFNGRDKRGFIYLLMFYGYY
jgi:hypothetical protein